MARKTHTIYVCQQCGAQSPRWLGKCPDCGEWNTLVETTAEPALSFLHTARSLNLDGPPDWSANLENYLYRSKLGAPGQRSSRQKTRRIEGVREC
jgi:predicted ATP-dependent serine protease